MKEGTAVAAAGGFTRLPVAKQIGLLIGLAASIALGAAIVLWSMEPSYRPLFSKLNSTDASEVADVLQRSGIDYKINKNNGTIMVGAEDIHDARMKLAAEGLPRGTGRGFEMFAKAGSFSSSQFMESAKYRYALESELARTISHFSSIKNARVHLAVPKQTSFLRDNSKASASVFIDIYRGMTVKSATVSAIVNLVASSVPNLDSSRVTVVDQSGDLLSDGSGDNAMAVADRFFDYRQQMEMSYANKVQELLLPILGPGNVKAKVSIDLDFTSSEQTRESFNPDIPALRSEQLLEEKRSSSSPEATGVPGATSNQPPANSTAQPVSIVAGSDVSESESSQDIRRQTTKNFELDKTISHTKQQPGRIRQLTVAVLVANKSVTDDSGETKSEPLTEQQISQLKLLVTNALGINTKRGDRVEIINSDFAKPEPIEPLPEISFWQQPWFFDIVKQVLAGLFVILMVFGVLLPTLRKLAAVPAAADPMLPPGQAGAAGQLPPGQTMAGGQPIPVTREEKVSSIQNMAGQDPIRVAQVVKTWIDGD